MIWWILFQATLNRWQIPGILTFPPHVLIVSYTSNSAGFNPSVLGLRLSKPGTWLAEPVLWTSWWHRGSLETESTSGQCGSLGRPSTGSTTQGFFELKRVEVEGIVSLLNIVLIFCWSLFSQKMTRWLDLRFITFSSSTILSCHAFMWRYLFSNHFLNLNGSDVVKSVGGALQQIQQEPQGSEVGMEGEDVEKFPPKFGKFGSLRVLEVLLELVAFNCA